MAVADKTTLAAKLAKVTAACAHVIKDKKNDHFNYSYASEAAIKEKVNAAISAEGVTLSINKTEVTHRFETESSRGGKMFNVEMKVCITFHDGESGETIETEGHGAGQDQGEKAVIKAMTSAVKAALSHTFLIATGDDPEATPDTRRQAAPRAQAAQRPAAQRADADLNAPLDADGRAKFYAYVAQNGWTQAQIDGKALATYGAGAPAKLTVGQARALAAISKVEKPPVGTPVVPGEDSDEDNGQVPFDPDDAFDQLGDEFAHESILAGARELADRLRAARISFKPPAPSWTVAEIRQWVSENEKRLAPVGATRG